MKTLLLVLMLVTVIAAVGALGVSQGGPYASLFAPFLVVAILAGLLFLILAARNGRKQQERRR